MRTVVLTKYFAIIVHLKITNIIVISTVNVTFEHG